jgi:hypothetical protein
MTSASSPWRWTIRSIAAGLIVPAILLAAGCLATGGRSNGWASNRWIYDSMSGLNPFAVRESRTWDDDEGFTQQLDLCQAGDRRFYVYHADISVCGSVEAVCRPHRFEMAFDETGAYLGYRVERTHPFTKAAHDPFVHRDYEQLNDILGNPTHPMADLPPPRRGLRGGEGNSGVDAVTGATVSYYAEHAVPKAFYTTHAIWHLANRSALERVQTWTLTWAGADQVRDWMDRGDVLKIWWFLDHLEKSALSKEAATDLAYESLAARDPRIQTAALRFLRRTAAPFRPASCRGAVYAAIPEESKTDFLDWWAEENFTDPGLHDALREDLETRIERSSPVAVAILKYLQRVGLPDGESQDAWRLTLRKVADRNPSTYLRNKAWQLLESVRPP